jgi:hypothetical protein
MLFPPRVIPFLADLRGPEWQQLVRYVMSQPQDHPETLGFMLMMIRLDGCMTCHADSYRAMRGCTLCAQQSVARFKGSDHDLIVLWQQACRDIHLWQTDGTVPVTE